MEMELEWLSYWRPDCAARHVGIWLIEPEWFKRAVEAVRDGVWHPALSRTRVIPFPAARVIPNQIVVNDTSTTSISNQHTIVADLATGIDQPSDRKPYFIDSAGISIIPIDGQMMKGESKYGGANTIEVRRQVRAAMKDSDVKGILLAIDSPGGTVSGTEELAADVLAARKAKPTRAHVDDLGASAAYWVASQTSRITASATSEIGSIGTLAVVEDFSGAAEKKGIKVNVISTGPYKGAGVPGTVVTDAHIAYVQYRVNAINDQFLAAVASGRKKSPAKVQDWADGRVWIASKAQEMGLIDGVMRFDQALEELRQEVADDSSSLPSKKSQGKARSISTREAIAAEIEKLLTKGVDVR